MLALPRIGMALTFVLVVAGQMVIAVILDHYKILVEEQHSFNCGDYCDTCGLCFE
jgi:transporter family-2 protein